MSKVYAVPYYPVGAILEFDRVMDMSSIYGGTWELYGKGRVTVGINTSDSDFDIVGKTGGHKALQSHTHTPNMGIAGEHTHAKIQSQSNVFGDAVITNQSGYGYISNIDNNSYYRVKESYMTIQAAGEHTHALEIAETGSGNAGNLQPYIVVYRYRKVAD